MAIYFHGLHCDINGILISRMRYRNKVSKYCIIYEKMVLLYHNITL